MGMLRSLFQRCLIRLGIETSMVSKLETHLSQPKVGRQWVKNTWLEALS